MYGKSKLLHIFAISLQTFVPHPFKCAIFYFAKIQLGAKEVYSKTTENEMICLTLHGLTNQRILSNHGAQSAEDEHKGTQL